VLRVMLRLLKGDVMIVQPTNLSLAGEGGGLCCFLFECIMNSNEVELTWSLYLVGPSKLCLDA
jgi:hypothetical protein